MTTSDQSLTKGHVRYLEARLIRRARDAGRVNLDNTQLPDAERRYLPLLEQQGERWSGAAPTVSPDSVRIPTKGVLWGPSRPRHPAHRVTVSDDLGEFMVGGHALCWADAERLVHKLEALIDEQRRAAAHALRRSKVVRARRISAARSQLRPRVVQNVSRTSRPNPLKS